MDFWLYVLRCADGTYYTGHTDDLDRRISEHHAGAWPGCYTATRRPLVLVRAQAFSTREEALTFERQLKGWSRAKKEAWFRDDWTAISRLARSSGKRSV